jgi:glutathione S-transferase
VIRLHHLEESRSQRIVWLLEELAIDYELVHYGRDPQTRRALPALRVIHPLGKSPVLEDGDVLLPESGAIVDYLVRRYGEGRLAPAENDPEFARYLQWLHFAEASGMFPLLLDMFLEMAGESAAGLRQHIGTELASYLSYMNDELSQREYFAGDAFTAADVMMGFVVEFASTRISLGDHPNLGAYLERMHARPAYQRALEKGRAEG